MGKRNLEQLFKEKLGDFKELPDDQVWKSIESSLDKQKQKKRVIPIWWRLGGVAAALAILLYVINPFGGNVQQDNNSVVDTEDVVTPKTPQDSDNILLPKGESQDAVVGLDQTEEEKQVPQNTVADVTTENAKTINSGLTESSSQQNDERQEANQKGQLTNQGLSNSNDYSAVAVNDSETSKDQKEDAVGQTPTEIDGSNLSILDSKEQNAVTQSDERFNQNVDDLKNTSDTDKAVAQVEEEVIEENEKQSIFDAIAEQEEEVVAQNSSNKWSVGPSVAPIYFNASGEGSPVHSNFAANSKSGNLDLSYGLTVAYEVGKKLTVRSGIHRVNFGYDTNDVVFSNSLNGSVNQIDNIDYSSTSRNVVVESRKTSSLNDASAEFAAESSAVLEGKMVQQIGYLEVPVELNYSLIDKKFGVNLIGGISSLFLVDNSVLLESEGLVTEMGEANNVNSLNFSTNVGLGFNYQFSPKVQLNLEPVFKYQLNTFSETAGSFRPFSVGVYSGFSFKF